LRDALLCRKHGPARVARRVRDSLRWRSTSERGGRERDRRAFLASSSMNAHTYGVNHRDIKSPPRRAVFPAGWLAYRANARDDAAGENRTEVRYDDELRIAFAVVLRSRARDHAFGRDDDRRGTAA